MTDASGTQPLVMKFGGTSVQDAQAMNRVVQIVRSVGGPRPVVVTSACAGITNMLVECARLCTESAHPEAEELVGSIRERHFSILHELSSPNSGHFCDAQLEELLDELGQIVHGTALLGETTPRTVDTILSFGERLSSVLLTTAFREAGIRAGLADSRRFIITDAQHSAAKPLMPEIEARIQSELLDLHEEYDVLIAQGFIGSTTDGTTTTIGRGGSDHSAALIGGAAGAPEIQIWTDVDGVMTADPRVVPDARAVRNMTFTEARELAWFGAKVIHPDTILPAVAKEIPVVIKNSMAPQEAGTTIYPDGFAVPPGIHSLTLKRNVLLVELAASDPIEGRTVIDSAIGTFARYDAPIECAVIAEARASVAIPEAIWNDRLRAALESLCSVTVRKNMALLCMVGSGLRDTPALLSAPLAALGTVSLRMVSAGSSDHIILAGLDEELANDALLAVHNVLFDVAD